jgi:glycosyltransferase involved in cell wall biosynthesis
VDRYIRIGAAPAGKIRCVSNGIDTGRFVPDIKKRHQIRKQLDLENRFVWLAVGRLEASKDYPNMIRAFTRVAPSHPEALLLIVGRGSLEREIKTLVRDANLEHQVRFLGQRQDIPDLMNTADAYLMSSAWEGLPMVLLEAAATSLPLVATDVGGNAEVVVPDLSGYLVPPNHADALADAMLKLMNLPPETLERLGNQARRHIETHFSIEHALDVWEGVYKELLSQTETVT